MPPLDTTKRIALLLLSTLLFGGGRRPPPCSALAAASGTSRRVLIAGAGGQTGQHVFRKLLARRPTGQYAPVGIVRTDASRDALLKSIAGGVIVPPATYFEKIMKDNLK